MPINRNADSTCRNRSQSYTPGTILPPVAGLSTRRALWLLAAGTLVFGLAQLPALGTMDDRGAGILAFELARTSRRAAEIVAEWGEEGRSAARQSLWLDYPYLIAYGLLLAGGCAAVARRWARLGRARLAALGRALAFAGLAAAGFDAIENVALLMVASEHTAQPWPSVAFACASVKFVLSGACVLYALIGWPATIRRLARPGRAARRPAGGAPRR